MPFPFSRLFRPSTLAYFREARGTPGLRPRDLLHGYVYGRWLYLYIAAALGRHPLARLASGLYRLVTAGGLPVSRRAGRGSAGTSRLADEYHGKVVTLEGARQLVRVDRPVTLRDLEPVIPFRLARDIVLRDPGHITVLDCPCRAARDNPCLPLDVCLVIGEPFASFALEHHPGRARRIGRDEALAILEAEHARGHVQHAFFKQAMLGRFYAICNCCSCCCGAIGAWKTGVPMLAPSGYTVELRDPRACRGCGQCAAACPFGALRMKDGRPVLNREACLGCGLCASACPRNCRTLQRDPASCPPLDLDDLLARVGDG